MKIRLGLSHIEMVRVITKKVSMSYRNTATISRKWCKVIDDLTKIGIKDSSNIGHILT